MVIFTDNKVEATFVFYSGRVREVLLIFKMKKYFHLVLMFVCLLPYPVFGIKISIEEGVWWVEAQGYKLASKNGYLNNLTIGGREFLAQKKVPGGSYLAGGGMPPLENIKLSGESSLSGSNELGEVNYQFTEKDIVCSYRNKTDKKAVYYFILSEAVTTVIANNAEMLELPAETSGRVFKWIQGDRSVEFQADSRIWGPWKDHQVFEIKVAAGETGRIKITPGRVLDTDSFNKLKGESRERLTVFDYRASELSKQIPLCMVGDSITWAGKGDYWRKSLLEHLPNLAFIGNHSALLGYSHAGEGGDSTGSVLARIDSLPDCPYYNLLIGTNNSGVREQGEIQVRAQKTAEDIMKIVKALLKKSKAEKVFLSSILPCFTKNPLRDQCNSETNRILRTQFKTAFPSGKVVWVEYEKPIRAIEGWEEKIKLHPSPEGYKIIADILARTIAAELPGRGNRLIETGDTGVQVVNLINKDLVTKEDVVAGWYTLSFKVDAIQSEGAQVILRGKNEALRFPFELVIKISADDKKVIRNIFTQYERYNYSRSAMQIETINCKISEVLFEKSRPSMKPSIYGEGAYIDRISPVMPGELLEYKK